MYQNTKEIYKFFVNFSETSFELLCFLVRKNGLLLLCTFVFNKKSRTLLIFLRVGQAPLKQRVVFFTNNNKPDYAIGGSYLHRGK